MNVRNLFTDDDAVSPVIGVILMVAITVILAAVIGAFVLNIGGSQESAPQATIDYTTTSNSSTEWVAMTHQSGDPLDADSITVKINNTDASFSNEMTAGDTYYINSDESVTENAAKDGSAVTGVSSSMTDANIKLVWNSPSSDSTSVISSYTVN